MKEMVYNSNNLDIRDINNYIGRVKVLIINSKNEVLLGFSHNTYQFPGGHIEEDENIEESIKREIKEETGIELKSNDFHPFFVIKYFNKNYPKFGINTCFYINYYILKTDESYNINRVNYTEYEKEGKFQLKYVHLDDVEEVLKKSLSWNKVNKVIVSEMLEVLKEYKKMNQYQY